MKFIFETKKENMKELEHIIEVQTKIHFNEFNAKKYSEKIEVKLDPVKYFADIEKFKKKLYSDLHTDEFAYMQDLLSEVEENLSFVPKLKCE